MDVKPPPNWPFPLAIAGVAGLGPEEGGPPPPPPLPHTLPLPLPPGPVGPPPTGPPPLPMPPAESLSQEMIMGPPLCAGCNLRIVDKFYLSAVDSKWHVSCLKCSECGMELESQVSCYERDSAIFCKEDYLRIYGANRLASEATVRQCARCLLTIGTNELVMRARCFLYHLDCFKCVICDVALIKGDLFGMMDAVVYCQAHFRQQQEHNFEDFPGGGQPYFGYDEAGIPTGFAGPPSHHGWSSSPSENDFGPNDNSNGGLTTSKKKRGRRKRDLSEDEASRNCFPYLDPTSGMVEKTKRARTSFKHHQLRIMKSHFQMNQNPDSRELKELASKTGLDKKVLQVWFQNARAKWRRMNNSQGMTASGCPPSSVLDSPPPMPNDSYAAPHP